MLLTVVCFLVGATATLAVDRYPDAIDALVGSAESLLTAAGGQIWSSASTFSRREPSAALAGSDIRIIDGDTIRLAGDPQSIRLVGFNTGETDAKRAQCQAELDAGKKARSRLREIVNSGTSAIEIVPCACRPGTQGTRACNYGRACGRLTVNGRDAGDILASEGLAARYDCGPTGCPRPPNRWC